MEKKEKKDKKKKLMKNIWRSLKLSFVFAKWGTLLLIVLTVSTYLLPILQSKIMGDVVNSVVDSLSGGKIAVWLVIVYAGVWSVTKILSAAHLYVYKIWYAKTEQKLEIMILKKRTEIDLGHYESPEFQNLLTRAFRRGIWPVLELTEIQIRVIGSIATFILTSVIATRLSLWVYLVVVLTSIPSFIVSLKYGSKTWTIWAENSPRQKKYNHVRGHISGRNGIIQSKILQASEKLVGMADEILGAFRKDQLKVDRKNLFWSSFASVVGAAGVGMGFYIIVGKVTGGSESVGSMVFLVSVLGQLVGAINSILQDFSRQFERNLYVDEIFQVLDTKPFIKRTENPISLSLEQPPMIEFKNVSFRYDGGTKDILKKVSFTIKPGEKIALVGKNGAGKSTLVKLLARIYDPTEGDIFVNGVNLKDVDPNEWSSSLGILLQDYLSYDFTVEDSISMGRADKEIDKEKVEKAADVSDAKEFISEFKDGFGQQLGRDFENGTELSKGQQQKMALARIVYRDGLITILDEPTASIDALAEEYIFNQMIQASNGKTLLVITHRFNTTQNLDKIVVLSEGRLVEMGSHEELLQKKGEYASMYESQAKAFREKRQEELEEVFEDMIEEHV